ncbi:MAG: hypothetical protein KBE65_16960 [Phycisphaerae bacterium]|nr:hypothetical protein [Phycisphaerae bacterium]
MSERKDERWLDAQLHRVINTTRPGFDAEAWKRNHAGAYRTLTSRAQELQRDDEGMRRRIRWMWGGVAAAAVILVGVTVLLTRVPQDRQESAPGPTPEAASPPSIVSMISLRTAYRQGGEEALNQQLDMALSQLGPRLNGLTTLRVVRDLDG